MPWCFHTSLILPPGQLSFVESWPLMNPNELVFVLTTYLLFVLKIGPIIMEGRAPLQIKGFLVFYNMFKVINSSILTLKCVTYISYYGLFPRMCEHDKLKLYIISIIYWKFMITKVLDLFDTVFFIVRKKFTQVTFLHVYHHVFMVFITWFCLKYDPTDHWAFMATSNSLIHTVMYCYYGISAMGQRYAKYIWWKKYLTMMQLVQFVLIIIHMIIQACISQCPVRSSTYWMALFNLSLFALLFVDFYKKQYSTVKKNGELIGLECTQQYNDL